MPPVCHGASAAMTAASAPGTIPRSGTGNGATAKQV